MLFVCAGIWLHESGVLGASPDGLVDKMPNVSVHGAQVDIAGPQLLEVKCPHTAREMTVASAAGNIKNFFLGNLP